MRRLPRIWENLPKFKNNSRMSQPAELWDAKRCAAYAVPRRIDPLRQRICGIYFLLRGNEVIYVGQSIDILCRVKASAHDSWGVTGFTYLECEREELSRLERILILAIKPKGNIPMSKRGFLCVPSLKSSGNVYIRIEA